MNIDPKWGAYLGLAVIIEQGIGHGTVSLTNLIPADWAPYVTSWANFLAFVGTSIMTYQAAVSGPQKGPLAAETPIPPVVKSAILLAFLLGALAFPGDAQAQVRKPLTGNIVNDIAAATGAPKIGLTGAPVTDLQNFFNSKLLPDLQYSLLLALAAKNTITADCYQAWINIITTQQTAVKSVDGTDIPMPDPHIITEFEKLVELRNALQPESTFNVKCSPVASMIKKDLTGLIGTVLAGGAGLATLVPGL